MKVNTLVSGTAVTAVTILAAVALVIGTPPDTLPPVEKPALDVIVEGAPSVMAPEKTGKRPELSVPLIAEKNRPRHEEGGEIEFCLPFVFPKSPCLTRDRIMDLGNRPIDRLTPEGKPRFESLLMVHPTDFREPEVEVRTCIVYARMKLQDWAPMTTAGMAAEGRFERYCGIIALAHQAGPATSSGFAGSVLTDAEIEAVAGQDWPQLGEQFEYAPIFSRDPKDDRRWIGNSETLLLTVHEIAHADFDNDGMAEKLLSVAGRARGGSAGFSSFMLFEYDEQGVGLRQVVWDFAIPERYFDSEE